MLQRHPTSSNVIPSGQRESFPFQQVCIASIVSYCFASPWQACECVARTVQYSTVMHVVNPNDLATPDE